MQTANPVAQQQMQIVCPPGAMAGAMIQVNVNGQMMTVQVRAYDTPHLATIVLDQLSGRRDACLRP